MLQFLQSLDPEMLGTAVFLLSLIGFLYLIAGISFLRQYIEEKRRKKRLNSEKFGMPAFIHYWDSNGKRH